MDRERMERCLEQVSAYRASGMKAKAWAAGNGVALLSLQNWCAHASRWQVRLDRVESAQPVRPSAFVSARVATVAPLVAGGPTVRLREPKDRISGCSRALPGGLWEKKSAFEFPVRQKNLWASFGSGSLPST